MIIFGIKQSFYVDEGPKILKKNVFVFPDTWELAILMVNISLCVYSLESEPYSNWEIFRNFPKSTMFKWKHKDGISEGQNSVTFNPTKQHKAGLKLTSCARYVWF